MLTKMARVLDNCLCHVLMTVNIRSIYKVIQFYGMFSLVDRQRYLYKCCLVTECASIQNIEALWVDKVI